MKVTNNEIHVHHLYVDRDTNKKYAEYEISKAEVHYYVLKILSNAIS